MYKYIKIILDRILSFVMFLCLSPLIVIVSIMIKVSSKGPILYKALRIGYNGNVFTVLKFRTMILETERDGKKLSDKERLYPLGTVLRKTSIDELPQLINIIKGEMSFIGPRPLPKRYLKAYTSEEFRRHDVLPGISGLAQVNGRNNLSWEERFKLDLYYVDHLSLILDAKIFIKTLVKVFKRSDVEVRDVVNQGNLDEIRKIEVEQ